MQLEYLHLKNFRQYRDVRIDFSRSPSDNFLVIQGINGAGKTNILNAITWCLFGEEFHSKSKYAGLPIVNTATLDNNKNGVVELSVEITFIGDNGKKIIFLRSKSYREKAGELVEILSTHVTPSVMIQTEREWIGPIYGSDAQARINSLIPPEIEEYFFFDGERLDDYFQENTGREIKDAVFEISQLQLLDRVIERLHNRKNDFVKKTKGLSPEAQNKRDEIEIHTRSLEVDKQELEKLEKQKSEAEILEREYSTKLQNSSLSYINGLQEQREIIDNRIDSIKKEIVELENERLKTLHNAMPTIFAYGPLKKTVALIESSIIGRKIPPMYQTIFIRDLLKKGRCICESDISENDEYSKSRRKKVEACLHEGELSEMSTELIETNVRVQEMIEKINTFPDNIRAIEKKLSSLRQEKEQKNERLTSISDQIKQSNEENIRKWETEKQKYAKEKEYANGQIILKNHQVERRENVIRALNIQLKQELKKESKHKALLGLLSFCDECIRCAELTKNTILKEVKSQVEEKASAQFLSLISAASTYKGLKIDDDYNISVPHVTGREALGSLSSGERQVCALAFMAALNSVSGFKVPVIIDTPLGALIRS